MHYQTKLKAGSLSFGGLQSQVEWGGVVWEWGVWTSPINITLIEALFCFVQETYEMNPAAVTP